MIYKSTYNSPIGNLTICSDGSNLIGLWIENQKYFTDKINEEMIENNNLEIFKQTQNWLDRYFAQENPKISELPITPKGNEFRQDVWKILCEIPYGQVTTYSDIAKKYALKKEINKMSPQAIGGAVGHNPISIIIPCHRVVGKNGSLTGYAGGINAKIKLLELEGVNMTNLFTPNK